MVSLMPDAMYCVATSTLCRCNGVMVAQNRATESGPLFEILRSTAPIILPRFRLSNPLPGLLNFLIFGTLPFDSVYTPSQLLDRTWGGAVDRSYGVQQRITNALPGFMYLTTDVLSILNGKSCISWDMEDLSSIGELWRGKILQCWPFPPSFGLLAQSTLLLRYTSQTSMS